MNIRYKQHRRSNRTTGAIVSAVSLIVIFAIAVPWVDEYVDLKRDTAEINDLADEIAQVRQRQVALERIESKLDLELKPFLEHNVTAEQIESVREALIEAVRSSKAMLRQLEIVPAEPRVWMAEDDARNDNAPLYGLNSRFVLQTHLVELQADGTLDAIKKIIDGINRQSWLAMTKTLNIVPTTNRKTPVTLELRLNVFGLELAQEVELEDEDFDIEDVARGKQERKIR